MILRLYITNNINNDTIDNMLKTYPEIIKIEKFGLTIKGWSRGSQNTGFMIPEIRTLFDTQSRSH